MLFHTPTLTLSGRPILRILATSIVSLFFYLLLRTNPSSIPSTPSISPVIEIARPSWSLFPHKPSYHTNTFYHAYIPHPFDLYLPTPTPQTGRSLATESLIAKVTILFHGKDPTLIRALQTHEVHNRLWGYPMYMLRHAILENIWSKPAYILAILLEELRKEPGQRLKWLFWTDADTVVMNPKISLDVFLPPPEWAHVNLLTTEDGHGLNNGVFFIKVDPWSVELLAAVIAFPSYRPEVTLQYRDQSALAEILKMENFKLNYLLLPQRWFNAYQAELSDDSRRPWQINRGDLLVHFAGVPSRDERIRAFLDRAERRLAEWEIDYQNTTYPREIEEFWGAEHEKLAKGREEASKAVGDARALLENTRLQLAKHSSGMDDEDVEKVARGMGAVKQVLEEREDDSAAVMAATERLEEARGLLLIVVKKDREEMVRRANAAIVDSKKLLQSGNQTRSMKEITERIDGLRDLLMRSPEDDERVSKAVEDLEETANASMNELLGQ